MHFYTFAQSMFLHSQFSHKRPSNCHWVALEHDYKTLLGHLLVVNFIFLSALLGSSPLYPASLTQPFLFYS